MNRFKGLILVFMLFSVSASFAQNEESSSYISKGQWMAGGRLSLSTGDDFDNYAFTISPMGGYFITKKFAAGLQSSYSHANIFNFSDGSVAGKNNTFSVAPFVRYYINTNRIAPFAELVGGANWSKRTDNFMGTESVYKNSSSFYALGMGLNYFISRDVALEGILRYTDDNGYDKAYLDFDLGLQFFFSRSNKSAADEEANHFSKGQWIIGGTGNLSLGALDDVDAHSFTISPMAGYLVGNKFAVGLSTAYAHIKGSTNSFFAAPFLRYYFTQKKLAPYAEVAYGGSWTRIEYQYNNETIVEKNSGSAFRIGAGLNYFISQNVALDGKLNYSHSNYSDAGTASLNVGLQFFIR